MSGTRRAANEAVASFRGDFRVIAYAESGRCEQRHVEGFGWCQFPENEGINQDELSPF